MHSLIFLAGYRICFVHKMSMKLVYHKFMLIFSFDDRTNNMISIYTIIS